MRGSILLGNNLKFGLCIEKTKYYYRFNK